MDQNVLGKFAQGLGQSGLPCGDTLDWTAIIVPVAFRIL